MTSTATFHLVRQGAAAKLGANSTGSIRYVVLIDQDRTEPFIALTGNDGGGYFSREAVSIAALRRCAEQVGTGAPLGASAFKSAFVGRSANNGYFAVAALCGEGLLNRVQRDGPGRGQPLTDAGFWDDWTAQVMAQAAELGDGLPVFHIGKPPADDQHVADAAETPPAGREHASDPTSAADGDDAPAGKGESAADDVGGQPQAKTRRKAKVRA